MSNQIVVGRHGKRWAVRVAPDVVPVSEFDTQAAAESAARVLADESPTGERPASGGELARETQQGL